jgi:hypothetical protein
MELHLHMPRWERREPDWQAAAVAGFAAGAVLMVLEFAWAAISSPDGPWRVAQLVAALTLGAEQTLHVPARVFDLGVVAAALLTHYGLGIAFGVLLGHVIAGFRLDGRLAATLAVGAGFGLLLYAANFHALSAFFPWFRELRGWSTLAAHLVFGTTAALLYWRLARRGAKRPRGA